MKYLLTGKKKKDANVRNEPIQTSQPIKTAGVLLVKKSQQQQKKKKKNNNKKQRKRKTATKRRRKLAKQWKSTHKFAFSGKDQLRFTERTF